MVAANQALETTIVRAYLDYMERKLAYFESQSLKLLGREMPQIMLIHANRLNADHLESLLAMLQKRGYQFVSVENVLRDQAFSLGDTFTGRGGISCLHRWAWTRNVDKAFFAGEARGPRGYTQARRRGSGIAGAGPGYSLRSSSTGLSRAERSACSSTAAMAMANVARKAKAKTGNPGWMR